MLVRLQDTTAEIRVRMHLGPRSHGLVRLQRLALIDQQPVLV